MENMKALALLSPLLFCLTYLSSCKKEENRRCFKSRGPLTEVKMDLPSFDRLRLDKNILFHLVPDSSDYLLVKGGKNLVNWISWDYDSYHNLHIQNKNKCSFLRTYEEDLEVEIHFKNINYLRVSCTRPVSCSDSIRANYFKLVVMDGSAPVQLILSCTTLNAEVLQGWGSYSLSGICDTAYLKLRSNGEGDAANLAIRREANFSSNSVGDLVLNANNIPLLGDIEHSGDVYYQGTPSSILYTNPGSGKLIKL